MGDGPPVRFSGIVRAPPGVLSPACGTGGRGTTTALRRASHSTPSKNVVFPCVFAASPPPDLLPYGWMLRSGRRQNCIHQYKRPTAMSMCHARSRHGEGPRNIHSANTVSYGTISGKMQPQCALLCVGDTMCSPAAPYGMQYFVGLAIWYHTPQSWRAICVP